MKMTTEENCTTWKKCAKLYILSIMKPTLIEVHYIKKYGVNLQLEDIKCALSKMDLQPMDVPS